MILERISAAALRVNVIATTACGVSTVPSSLRNRWISSSVFPEPAGACTMKDVEGSSACWRASRSRFIRELLNAAESLQSAIFAGVRRGVHLSHACQILCGHVLEGEPPFIDPFGERKRRLEAHPFKFWQGDVVLPCTTEA